MRNKFSSRLFRVNIFPGYANLAIFVWIRNELSSASALKEKNDFFSAFSSDKKLFSHHASESQHGAPWKSNKQRKKVM